MKLHAIDFSTRSKNIKITSPADYMINNNLLSRMCWTYTQLKGKRFRKRRYFYTFNGRTAEVDIYLDDLERLGLIDFEFNSREEKNKFKIPDFCLADVTQEKFLAGGMLAGKKYSDIQPLLDRYNYQKLEL